MIEKIDRVYQLQQMAFRAIDWLYASQYYKHFGLIDERDHKIEELLISTTNEMAEIYNQVNEIRRKQDLTPLTNPYITEKRQ